jgi:predicted nucleotide-binding protein
MQVLDTLVDRISKADIYLADVSDTTDNGFNPNVMVELGMAIATGHGARGSLFILKPKALTAPSNLSGILWTDYERGADRIKFVDAIGFKAALTSRLLQIGSETNRIFQSRSVDFEDDDGPKI